MIKNYIKRTSNLSTEKPTKETIAFLLNYSKSLRIVNTKFKKDIALNLN